VDEVVEQEGEPVGEHLLGDGLVAPQQDLGVAVLGLDGLLDEVGEEREEHVGEVVHVVVEAQAQERGQADAVLHEEGAGVGLERAYEGEQEVLVEDELGEHGKAALDVVAVAVAQVHARTQGPK